MKLRLFTNGKEWLLLLFFYLLLLQNPLGAWQPVFNYIDECLALAGPLLWAYRALGRGKIVAEKGNLKLIAALVIFLAVGLSGNVIYDYQETPAVLEDLYVNLKFFLVIVTGYELLCICNYQNCKRVFLSQAKLWAVVFFLLLIVDLVFEVFESGGTRYELRVVQLFYGHPTNLASAMVFLMAVLTLFHEKQNNKYLFMTGMILFFTLRGKAIAAVVIYFLIYFFILKPRKKLRVWHFALLVVAALVVAWEQFVYYYIDLGGTSARSALTMTSIEIAGDYFPIGTGFGTFASNVAAENYSPVYHMYGLNSIYGLGESNTRFGSDTFWPIIIGQTGVIGTVCYVYVLVTLFLRVLKIRIIDLYAYSTGIFIFAYMIISSTSESTFCNALSIPLALILGVIYAIGKNSSANPENRRIRENG